MYISVDVTSRFSRCIKTINFPFMQSTRIVCCHRRHCRCRVVAIAVTVAVALTLSPCCCSCHRCYNCCRHRVVAVAVSSLRCLAAACMIVACVAVALLLLQPPCCHSCHITLLVPMRLQYSVGSNAAAILGMLPHGRFTLSVPTWPHSVGSNC
jgi:hypothetical protein